MNSFFTNLTNLQRILVLAIVGIVVYVVSAGTSYSLFARSVTGGSNGGFANAVPTAAGIAGEDPSEPKVAVCPLNGNMHTQKSKDAWDKRRPLAVMIENHVESRPQSGLSYADVVYEAVAEGGITRFMGMYYCNSLPDVQLGPVRSARTYFLDWLSEYDALYAHVGGANTPGPANALGQIIDYKIKDLNQFSIGFPTFWRDYQRLGRAVATEHTMYTTTHKLWDVGEKRDWTATDSAGLRWDAKFVPWKSKEDQAGGDKTKVTVNFWEGRGDYQVQWSYDKGCNCYKRSHGGTSHTDLNNKQQLSPKNVVVQFMRESHANDGYENNAHLLYTNKGQGKALIFQDGKVIEGQWTKANRLAREKFLDESGKEIEFNKGQIWIQTVPEGSSVDY